MLLKVSVLPEVRMDWDLHPFKVVSDAYSNLFLEVDLQKVRSYRTYEVCCLSGEKQRPHK